MSVEFKARDFPNKYRNTFNPRDNSFQQKLLDEEKGDRRVPLETNDKFFGLLRMEFGNSCYVGSAIAITMNKHETKLVILTAAHNIVDVDPIKKNTRYADNAWFESETPDYYPKKWRVRVLNATVHPRYFRNPTSHSGFDLAVLIAEAPNNTEIMQYFNISLGDVRGNCVVGFPGEKRGKLYGSKGKPITVKGEIFIYTDIDTTKGNSGSAILHNYMCNNGAARRQILCGIHTGGDFVQGKNWGTRFTESKVKWICSMFMKQNGFYKNYNRYTVYDKYNKKENYNYIMINGAAGVRGIGTKEFPGFLKDF